MRLFRRSLTTSPVSVAEKPTETIPAHALLQPTVEKTELEQYSALAKKIGFAPVELLRHEVIQFLHDNFIEVYPLEAVEAYLDKKFEFKRWSWHPLRSDDVNKLRTHSRYEGNGSIEPTSYTKVVPIPVLETVDLIATHFAGSKPSLHFFVADEANRNSGRDDPFLAILAEGMSFIVIERWDEPGFRR